MIDFPVFIWGFLFTLETRTENRALQRPIEAYVENP